MRVNHTFAPLKRKSEMKKPGLLLLGLFSYVFSVHAQEKTPPDSSRLPTDSLPSSDSLIIAESFLKDFRALIDSLELNTSFFMANVSVGNRLFSLRNNNFNAQQITTNRISVTPFVNYFHKSGLSIGAATFITSDSGKIQFYQYAISPGFDYMKGKHVTYGISYTRYLTKNDVSFYTTPFKNEFFGYITTKKGWIRPGLSAGWANGQYKEILQFDTVILGIRRMIVDTTDIKLQDFSLVGSVSHFFEWDDVFTSRDNITIAPQLSLAAGSQRYDTDTKGKLLLGKKGRISRRYNYSSVENTGLRFQAVSFSLYATYFISNFSFTPMYFVSYYIPESENKISHIFSVTAGISF